MKTLLIGCGHSRTKLIYPPGKESWEGELVTLDMSKEVKPDVVHDLNVLPYPFEPDEFDELHAYEVLEHVGTQGDFKFFFKQFDEFARILKSDGLFMVTCPRYTSVWAWADPGHTRLLSPETFGFLDREWYDEQIARDSRATDYRPYFTSNWKIDYIQLMSPIQYCIVLRNVKQ